MTTLVPPLIITTRHGNLLRDWQAVPCVGEFVDLPFPVSDDVGVQSELVLAPDVPHPHQVIEVEWSDAAVTIECECEEGIIGHRWRRLTEHRTDRERSKELSREAIRGELAAVHERDRLRAALRQIVGLDYRGNEPPEQAIARAALATEDKP